MIGKWVKHYRQLSKLTQEELASKTNLSILSISRYENELREPRASDIQKLCEVLGVTEAELLNGPKKNEIEIQIIIREFDETEVETMDVSPNALYRETVTIAPERTALCVVFSKDVPLKDVLAELATREGDYEKARAALYGKKTS